MRNISNTIQERESNKSVSMHSKHLLVEKSLVVLTNFFKVQITIDFLHLNLVLLVLYIDLNAICIFNNSLYFPPI